MAVKPTLLLQADHASGRKESNLSTSLEASLGTVAKGQVEGIVSKTNEAEQQLQIMHGTHRNRSLERPVLHR